MANIKNLNALARQAKANINNAYDRIERLREALNFQQFGDREPEILVTNEGTEYDISLWWDDTIYSVSDVIHEYKKYGIITPKVLYNMLCNI